MAKFVAYTPFDAISASLSLYQTFTINYVTEVAGLDSNEAGLDGTVYRDSYSYVGGSEAGNVTLTLRGEFNVEEAPPSLVGTAKYLSIESELGPLYYLSETELNLNDVYQLFEELPNIQVHPLLLDLLSGDDEIFLSTGDDFFFAGSGDDTVQGDDGYDTIVGDDGDDVLHTGGNDGPGAEDFHDEAFGQEGNDYIYAHSGKELISGDGEEGSGIDTVSFAETDSGVVVSLAREGVQAVRAGHIVELISIENLVGSSFNDVLTGTASENTVDGGEGDDTLDGAGGEDLLDGSSGQDTARYHGNRADFTIGEGGSSVGEVADPNDIDALFSIEKVEFDDGALVFDIDSENVSFAYRIYAAAYGRTPDEAGLRFWTDVLDDRGEGPPDVDDKEFVASFFLTADEFTNLYGTDPTNEEYINALYENVLHREADQAGYDFWLGVIASGQGKDDLLIWFTDSTENLDNTAPDLDNGIWVL